MYYHVKVILYLNWVVSQWICMSLAIYGPHFSTFQQAHLAEEADHESQTVTEQRVETDIHSTMVINSEAKSELIFQTAAHNR